MEASVQMASITLQQDDKAGLSMLTPGPCPGARSEMRILVLVAAMTCAFSPVTFQAQEPSMVEIKAWLEQEAIGLLGGFLLPGLENIPVSVTDLKLDNCVLGWTMDAPRNSPPVRISVPLKDLDINRLTVSGAGALSTDRVSIFLRASATTMITSAPTDGSATSMSVFSALHVRSVADGQRVANAIRRAATLCGAPSTPL